MKNITGRIYKDVKQIKRKEWEAIQASFSVTLVEGTEDYNKEIIDKYDFRAGTNPMSFQFNFENGEVIYLGWYVEEFGGAVEWGDSNGSTIESEFDLDLRTEFTETNSAGETISYVCEFEIID